MKSYRRKYKTRFILLAIAALAALFLLLHLSIPRPLFNDPYSFVLLDRDGHLMGARIADDGQWRFPESDGLPEKYITAVLSFEDNRFYYHPGIDPLALGRAAIQNIKAGRVVSGGSTLNMQLARMSRKNPPRTISNKLLEMWMALAIELHYSKRQIIAKYAAHAPFGGNVVGLEMAAYRYFGKPPSLLSWAEAATLAVLPNSPSLIHPGRNQDQLRAKRNALLDRMYASGSIDSLDWVFSKLEPLPEKPNSLPDLAPHFLEYARAKNNNDRFHSTIDPTLQSFCNQLTNRHQQFLSENAIHNLSILILDTESGKVRAYIGNGNGPNVPQKDVDMIQAERSSGSILKPFLYGAAWDRGLLLPRSLIEDMPVSYNGYKPENFHRQYDGMVPVNEALIRSLNVPAVGLLKDFGIESFRSVLHKAGLSTIRYDAGHYGLTLVLGGAEVTLWELTAAYAGLGKTLIHWEEHPHTYLRDGFATPVYKQESNAPGILQIYPVMLSAGATWLMLNTLQAVDRPNEHGTWEQFSSNRRIAWKTGTSYGFRDAWAVGVNPEVTIGVWAGNADGEGRPGIIGSKAAAPILFELLSFFERSGDFPIPYDDLDYGIVCTTSGQFASSACPSKDTIFIPISGNLTDPCPYHREIFVDRETGLRADRSCASTGALEKKSWFVLPPGPAWYYAKTHPGYLSLPQWKEDCRGNIEDKPLTIVYPGAYARIELPVELNGQTEPAVMQAAHRNPSETIHWHLDGRYLTSTQHFHTVALNTSPGQHQLVIVDGKGNRDARVFEVME